MEEEEEKEKTGPSISQTRPIFAGHSARIAVTDEEAATFAVDPGALFSRPRRYVRCCGLCLTVVLLVGVVAIVLAFTVFRVQDPTLTMNNIFLADVLVSGSSPPSVNASVVADISVRNPNVAALHFGDSVTEFYVEGKVVGTGLAAGSRVGSKDTTRMNVTADVVASAGVGAGMLGMTSRTEVMGHVSVLGIFKRNVGVTMGCNMTFNSSRPTAAEAAVSRSCVADVK
ncbi:hypothetical protein HPP92_023632 [Vanilla planifolia]|uniref:Late embryogenesis abundant protein LEA-2 subgroup domain-containing protein n=1 Tax=Vanilla planifolia TaxID=51239 RepID=A0A835UAK7_VANPL|nr:hypothetical protein HPP92_023940 [Vanilla planifolia]KAG0455844.1 hypothetical protein HPP92_023632 [Vanilla planifolia]